MWFDADTFLRLVEKNERKFFSGKSIKDIREAMEFFQSPSNRGRRGIAYSESKLAKERISRALDAMGLTLGEELPQDPSLKNKIWKGRIEPMQEALREIFEYKKFMIELELPKTEVAKRVDELLKLVAQENLKTKSEGKIFAKKVSAKKKKIQQEQEEARQAQQQARLELNAEADLELAEKLIKSAERELQSQSINFAGYLYFKAWVLPDGSKWYKIGITNDLRRRDAEQNVLPVPATTLQSIRFFSIEHARIVEKKFLNTLSVY